ncbi:MAG: hypothetical protein ACI8UX_001806 [Psychromonas sp.]|jgi:hypothetical protein
MVLRLSLIGTFFETYFSSDNPETKYVLQKNKNEFKITKKSVPRNVYIKLFLRFEYSKGTN